MDNGEFDLLELVSILWGRKWFIAAIIALSMSGAVLYLNYATYIYTAEMKIVPVDVSSGPRIGGNIAGLANLAGIRFGIGKGNASFDLYLDGLTSIETAMVLEQNQKVMQTIFAGEWDSSAQSWREQESNLRTLLNRIKSLLGLPVYAWRPPDAIRLRSYLSGSVEIKESEKSSLTVVSLDHEDSTFAKELLTALNSVVDERLRVRALERADASIAYLKSQLLMVQVTEYRQALVQTLSEQEKQRMMASSGLPFAADIVSGPVASAFPIKPQPRVVVMLAALAGGFAGALLAFLSYALANALAERRLRKAA